MGRVTRMMKAATVKGPEGKADGPGRDSSATDPDLPRLLACWGAMPPHFRETIMSLVEVVESKQRVAPTGGKR